MPQKNRSNDRLPQFNLVKYKINPLKARMTEVSAVRKSTQLKPKKLEVDSDIRPVALFQALSNGPKAVKRMKGRSLIFERGQSNQNGSDNLKSHSTGLVNNPLFRAINNLSRTKPYQNQNSNEKKTNNQKAKSTNVLSIKDDKSYHILRIINLNLETTRRDLLNIMMRIGQVDDLRLREEETSITAEVLYKDRQHAIQVIELLHDQLVDGNYLQLRLVKVNGIPPNKNPDSKRQ